jgi:hypothetical protein
MQRMDLALPDHHYLPTALPQLSPSPFVSCSIATHLGDPVAASRRRYSTPRATVHVPETTVDVNNPSQSRKYKIGSAWERTNVQTITVAEGMHETADHQFRGRVLRLDRRHDAGSLGLCEGVGHGGQNGKNVPILGANMRYGTIFTTEMVLPVIRPSTRVSIPAKGERWMRTQPMRSKRIFWRGAAALRRIRTKRYLCMWSTLAQAIPMPLKYRTC